MTSLRSLFFSLYLVSYVCSRGVVVKATLFILIVIVLTAAADDISGGYSVLTIRL